MSTPTNYAALIASARADGNDTATSNPHFGETPIGIRNGTNTLFRLAYPNVVAASLFLTYGATIRSQSGFTVVDQPSSYITITAPPDSGLTQPFFFDFYSQWFPDADYMSMIDLATQEVGGVVGVDVGNGLYAPLIKFTLAHYWERRASQFANQFASKVSTADSDPSSPTKAFLALAKAARAEGNTMLKQFQKGFEQNLQPFSGTTTMRISPITPPY